MPRSDIVFFSFGDAEIACFVSVSPNIHRDRTGTCNMPFFQNVWSYGTAGHALTELFASGKVNFLDI